MGTYLLDNVRDEPTTRPLDPVLTAFAARRFGVQNRLILAGVQMPPLAFRLMVVQLAAQHQSTSRGLYKYLNGIASKDKNLYGK
jgi:hypothetical protein